MAGHCIGSFDKEHCSALHLAPNWINGHWCPTTHWVGKPCDGLPSGGGGGLSYERAGMLVVSHRGVNFGCSGQNAIIFSREGLV